MSHSSTTFLPHGELQTKWNNLKFSLVPVLQIGASAKTFAISPHFWPETSYHGKKINSQWHYEGQLVIYQTRDIKLWFNYWRTLIGGVLKKKKKRVDLTSNICTSTYTKHQNFESIQNETRQLWRIVISAYIDDQNREQGFTCPALNRVQGGSVVFPAFSPLIQKKNYHRNNIHTLDNSYSQVKVMISTKIYQHDTKYFWL